MLWERLATFIVSEANQIDTCYSGFEDLGRFIQSEILSPILNRQCSVL